MVINDFEILIASWPDKEYVVAEIFYKGEEWAEISQETKEPIVQFFPPPNGEYWQFSFNEAIDVLEKAKKHLLGKECG